MQKFTNLIENKKKLAHRNFSTPTYILGNVSNFRIKQQQKMFTVKFFRYEVIFDDTLIST